MTVVSGRRRPTLVAATVISGPVDVLDLVLPLWAGAVLGARPAQIGLLLALELLASFAFRPAAGYLADTRERTHVAALGAGLYAVSCLGYAFAPGIGTAYVAALVGGAGGALLWVSIRAIMAEFLAQEPGVFARLLSAESTGTFVFFAPAMFALAVTGYREVLIALAVVCLVAVAVLLTAPGRKHPPGSASPSPSLRAVAVRLRGLLMVASLTTAAEAGIGLLLLLHLQRSFDLEAWQIALVFAPGGVAMVALPPLLHGQVQRWGRRTMFSASSLVSASFAAALALAPGPLTVAGLWVLTASAWATLGPIERAVMAELTGDRLGSGMGLIDGAKLIGGAVGVLLAGVVYGTGSWSLACLAFAAIIAAGALLGPRALDALDVSDQPSSRTPLPD